MSTRASLSFTEQQQAAIDHRGSPLRIIAGAGTGKTATLTARFVSMVQNNEAEIGEVLALTFTRKAAAEMRERIIARLDRSYTEFWVETFHAFCQRVLRIERASRGLPPLTVLDGHARLQRLEKAIDGHTFPSYGSRRAELLRQSLVFIDRAKDELLTPQDAYKLAESHRSAQLYDLAVAYDLYQRELEFGDRDVDWGELQTRLITLFETNERVLQRWRDRFKFILVDEYQDVNQAQCRLIEMLAGDGNNLTVVGDVDQSIYAFRGASHRLLAEMDQRLPATKTIYLTSNFRSPQPILDAGNTLISANPDSHQRQPLVSHGGRSGTVPTVIEARDELEEADAIARQIARLYWLDNVPLDQIAVLLRSVQISGAPIEQALASYGLRSTYPTNLSRADDASADVLAVLRALESVTTGDLIRLLTSQDVSDVTILSTLIDAREQGVDQIEALTRMNLDIAPAAQRVLRQLQDLEALDLPEQVYQAARICGRLPLPKTITRADHRYVQSLRRMIDRAMQVAESGGTRQDFVSELEGAAEPVDSDDAQDSQAVQIMTIHAAKGLEFDHVFVAGLIQGRFPLNRRLDRGLDLRQPESLRPDGNSPVDGDDQRRRAFLEEERRLGYVAMTRARQHLYLTYASSYPGIGSAVPAFVNDLRAAGDDLVTIHSPAESGEHTWNATELARLQRAAIDRALDTPDLCSDALADVLLAQWTLNELPGANLWHVASTPAPFTNGHNLRLSYSALTAYQKCPRSYYYSRVLNLSEERSSAYSLRGSAVHEAIQWMNIRRRDGAFPTERELIDHFRAAWVSEGFETAAQERQIREQSERLLRRFHRYEQEHEREILEVELRFDAPLGTHSITGRIDCVARRPDGTIEIIDYKSSKSVPTEAERQLQLGIYQIAYQHLQPDSRPEAVIYALGHKDDKPGAFQPEFDEAKQMKRLAYDPDAIGATAESILETAASILRNEFPVTTRAYDCRSCHFRHICEGPGEDG